MTTLEANTKYVNLINHYKMFPPKDGEYFEVHHIVPRAIAPELANEKTNLVKLPFHAHVLAHLYYAYSLEDGDKHKFGQLAAYHLMLNKKRNISEEFILEHAEELDAARAKFRELDRIANTGKNNPMFGKNAYEGKTDEEMEEIRKKKSKANSGENNPMFGKNPFAGKTEEEMAIIKQKISDSCRGKKRTDDTKKKISEATKGENNPMYGKQLSDDTKKKISEKNKGKKLSDDAKQKISEAKRKPFEIDGIRFESQEDAARHFEVRQNTISRWLNGKLKTDHKCRYVDKL